VEFCGVVLMFFLLKDNLYLDEEFFRGFKMRDVNFFIVMLVIILFLIVLLVPIYYKFRLNLLLIILYYLIRVRDLVVFFYCYEMVFVLILFSIILLGYRYERLMASFIIMFYSFIFSSPVLLVVLVLDYRFLMKNWLGYSVLLRYFFVGSFMVKFPVFGFHY
jgi:hypothetical protein